jgi:hypothetical protein
MCNCNVVASQAWDVPRFLRSSDGSLLSKHDAEMNALRNRLLEVINNNNADIIGYQSTIADFENVLREVRCENARLQRELLDKDAQIRQQHFEILHAENYGVNKLRSRTR